jgi:peptidyl-prolyl cis-trans isomerase C
MTTLLLAAALAPAAPEPDVAAVVNGQSISVAELDAALKASLPPGPITAGQRRHLRTALLDDLIDDLLVKQFVAANGPKADAAELDAQMKALVARLAKENRTLADYLKETGRTEAQLRDEWAVRVSLAGYVKGQVTDEQLKAYHAANRDHYDRVEVRVSHVVVRVPRAAPATERAAAREKLRAVRADLLAGKLDFPAAARKFSQCQSAKAGGDLGFIPRRALPEDESLAKAAFALKVGEVSDAVETEYGVHLLTVTDRKPGTPSALEKCLPEVLEDYTDDYRAELVKRLRKDARIRVTLP